MPVKEAAAFMLMQAWLFLVMKKQRVHKTRIAKIKKASIMNEKRNVKQRREILMFLNFFVSIRVQFNNIAANKE